MPELPEVETVRNGLAEAMSLTYRKKCRFALSDLPRLEDWHFARKDLRYPLPIDELNNIKGYSLLRWERRSKYLLLYLIGLGRASKWAQDDISLSEIIPNISIWSAKLQLCCISIHLGMSGCLKLQSDAPEKLGKHDHLWARIKSPHQEYYILYNDVRRFGFWDFVDLQEIMNYREFPTLGMSLRKLGCEPIPLEEYGRQAPITLALLSYDMSGSRLADLGSLGHVDKSKQNWVHAVSFRDAMALGQHLYDCSQKTKRELKPWLLDGKIICGVGNIYCSESLWQAGISPRRPANQLSFKEALRLAGAIQKTIIAAIAQGGTTLKDFLNATGKPGYFQQDMQAYGREGQNCRNCTEPIVKIVQAQRSTYYCPKCQK